MSSNSIIQSQCNCGKVTLDITLQLSIASSSCDEGVFNCHCSSCRKYHTAAYTSFLRVTKDQISIRSGHDAIGKFTCQTVEKESNGCYDDHDKLERWYCTKCSSKLVSVEKKCSDTDHYLVNLGPLNEDTIPCILLTKWKEQLKTNNVHAEEMSSWNKALPNYTTPAPPIATPPPIWIGSCACGSCRYQIAITRAAQLQHCYCHLCRELSGGAFATWIPIYRRDFEWKNTNNNTALDIVRTTEHGKRHICKLCRGVLTIVYDFQPDLIWPCVGSLDDESLPPDSQSMSKYLKRVCHICCRHAPLWMDLPDDEMERLDDAS